MHGKATTLAGKSTTARGNRAPGMPPIAANTAVKVLKKPISRFDRDLPVRIRDLPDKDLSCRMENSALTNLVQLQATNRYVISDSTSTHGQG